VIGLLELLAIGYAIFLAVLIVHSAWALTHPHRKTYAWAVSRGRAGDPSELPGPGRPFTSWTFNARGRTLAVWDIPGDDAAGPTLILSHGWADSRLGGLVRIPFLAPTASRLILWDVRGHGEAPGACHLGTTEVTDLLALIEAVGGSGLVLYGWSLGAGVSIAAGARSESVSGVIAEAPYRQVITPAWNVMRGFRLPYRLNLPPAMWLLGMLFGVGPAWRGFDRAVLASKLRCPLLIIHGDQDAVCPVRDARDIAAAAPRAELLVVSGGGHNNLWTEPAFADRCAAAARKFMDGLATESPRPAGTLEP
jgi:pimeloyl-ACP methyl ester carboxylesterase